jgi:hypothetical protein
MKLRKGTVFNGTAPDRVIDFLNERNLETLQLPSDRLHIGVDGEELILQVMNGKVREFPLRESFFLKLLKWGSLPSAGIRKLSIDTIADVLNDILLAINSGDVSVKIENQEALAITSRHYSELSDLEVIRTTSPHGIAGISRTDFFLRVYCDIKTKSEIVPGDTCGFGFNVLNSETGFRSLSVHRYILRYVCSNGAIVRLGDKHEVRSHYRHPAGYLQTFLRERLQPGEMAAGDLVGSLKRAMSDAAPLPEHRIYTRLRSLVGPKVLQEMLEPLSKAPSVYGLFNLITSHARGLEPGQRLQLETLAGELLMHQN